MALSPTPLPARASRGEGEDSWWLYHDAPKTAPKPSIEGHTAADIGGHVEVFTVVDGGFAFLESALGNDVQRQHTLAHFRPGFPIGLAMLLGQQLLFLLRRKLRCGRHEPRRRPGRRVLFEEFRLQGRRLGPGHGRSFRRPALRPAGRGRVGRVAITVTERRSPRSASTAAPMTIWAFSQARLTWDMTLLISAMVRLVPPTMLTNTDSASLNSAPPSSSGLARRFSTTSRARWSPGDSAEANELSACRPRTTAQRSAKSTWMMPARASNRQTPRNPWASRSLVILNVSMRLVFSSMSLSTR